MSAEKFRILVCVKFWIFLDQKAALVELYECIVLLYVTLFKDELNKAGCIGDAYSLCAEGLDLFPMIRCWLLPCAPDAFTENH